MEGAFLFIFLWSRRNGVIQFVSSQALDSRSIGPLVRICIFQGGIGSWISHRCLLAKQTEVHEALALKWTLVVHERITLR